MNKELIYKIGFGTWKIPQEITSEVVGFAIENGYRLIDTAKAYGNEKEIGNAIKNASVNRNELYIQGKLWNVDRGYYNVIRACKETINNLKCEYLDMYLIHWPASIALYDNWAEINNETWEAFEYLKNSGLVKNIGVCNFKQHHLDALKFKDKPSVNQIEFHIGYNQKELVDFCNKNDIIVEGWSPLGSGKLIKNQNIQKIAEKYNVSASQLCLQYCIQNSVIPLCRSKTKERILENYNIDSFVIDDEDIKKLDNFEKTGYSNLDPDTLTLFG